MKQLINNRLLFVALFILAIAVMVKVIWLVVAILFLPKSGVEFSESTKVKALYYPIKLASSSPTVVPIKQKTPKRSAAGNMQGYKLIALYNASDALVVVVSHANKTKVLAKGEDIEGFVLKSATDNSALFTKGGKEFELTLKRKNKTISEARHTSLSSSVNKPSSQNGGIQETDDGKVVSKELLSSYTKNIDKIWKDIGISEHKESGEIKGFKINFIKRGSDFEKLGLKRGDILTSANGQELNSYNAAFSFYKEIDNLENLTLGIKRNNQEMELEYEIE